MKNASSLYHFRPWAAALVLGCQFLAAGWTADSSSASGIGESENAKAPSATWPKLPWRNQYIDTLGNVGQYISLTATQSGTIWASYYAGASGALKAARYVGTGGNCGTADSWICETVDSVGDVGRNSSIASYQNKIAIAYQDSTNRSLKLATRICLGTCFWSKETIEIPESGDYIESNISLRFNSSGTAYILYFLRDSNPTLNQIRLAHQVPSGGACIGTSNVDWDCEQVSGGYTTGSHASLAFDSFATPCVARVEEMGSSQELWQSCKPENSWNHFRVETKAQVKSPSLHIQESNSKSRIAYFGENGRLRFTEYVGYSAAHPANTNCGYDYNAKHNDWNCYDIDIIGSTTEHVGLAMDVDDTGNAVIAYMDAFSNQVTLRLKAAFFVGSGGNCGFSSAWKCLTLDSGSQYKSEAYYASVFLDSGGVASIAYTEYDSYNDTHSAKIAAQYFYKASLPLVKK